SGSVTWDGPLDTWRSTVPPCGAGCPALGLCANTWPTGAVSLGVSTQLPVRLKFWSVCLAWSQVMPITFGTFTLPLDTNRVTTLCGCTGPGLGAVRTTMPLGSLDDTFTGAPVRPFWARIWSASGKVLPRRLGRSTLFG